MDPNFTPAQQDASVNFWSDHANIEDLHYRVLMGEKVHVPPRPGCNMSPDWSYPQALAQMEQVTRRPSPSGAPAQTPRAGLTPGTGHQGPPNISSLHVSGATGGKGPKPGSTAFSPRRPVYGAAPPSPSRLNTSERLRPGLTPNLPNALNRQPLSRAREDPSRQRPLAPVSKPTGHQASIPQSSLTDPYQSKPHQTPSESTARSLFPNFGKTEYDRKPQESVHPQESASASQGLPSNAELVGKKHEKAAATLLRLRNQRPIDPDLIFGTANFEVPLKRIFASYKEAALFVSNDQRGISGDWNRDIYDEEEETEYKHAVGIKNLPTAPSSGN